MRYYVPSSHLIRSRFHSIVMYSKSRESKPITILTTLNSDITFFLIIIIIIIIIIVSVELGLNVPS